MIMMMLNCVLYNWNLTLYALCLRHVLAASVYVETDRNEMI